ncbi:MAG: QueT transporter family protein [Clostridium sp.]|uniref:QueT transporter family protein n=1 Tax=Clostridium sp. TaxID=1506 RepID=UPI003EE4B12B
MRDSRVLLITKLAIVCALYAGLTIGLAPIGYGIFQIRLSEVLVLLAFFDRRYVISLTLGCLIANLMSPFGAADIIFGTLGTLCSTYLASKSKNMFIASLWPTIFCLPVVWFLHIFASLPFWISLFGFCLGEFIAVTVIGYPLYRMLVKRKKFLEIIKL